MELLVQVAMAARDATRKRLSRRRWKPLQPLRPPGRATPLADDEMFTWQFAKNCAPPTRRQGKAQIRFYGCKPTGTGGASFISVIVMRRFGAAEIFSGSSGSVAAIPATL